MVLLSISYTFLQHYWWAIISILAALLVFLLFVQGGQTLLYRIAKTEDERSLLVNVLGRKWELTFTTLVTFGGAFFASFPLFYSTSFGGAYWVWIAILFCFVLQTVGYEYRSKPNNLLGSKTYEIFLLINGLLGTFLIGVAVGTFFTGSEFSVQKENIANIGEFATESLTISQWKGPAHGLEAVLNIQNLLLGFSIFFLARVLGILYFMNSVNNSTIFQRAKKQLLYNGLPFVVFFVSFLVMLLLQKGFSVEPTSKLVYLEQYKYFYNFIEMPIVFILFLSGVLITLYGIIISLIKTAYTKGIWFSGIGVILVVFCLFLVAGYNNTAYYSSIYDLQHSLTIENSSSSEFTLYVMSIVSLAIPFVAAYIWWAWSKMNKKKISIEEINSDEHSY